MKKLSYFVVYTIIFMLYSVGAIAQVKDKTFKAWTVYTTNLQGQKTCYIASFPKSKTGNYKRRDEPYFLVTNIEDGSDEVSTSAGYKYKKNSDVRVNINGKKFKMFTKGELAWASDSIGDTQMVKTMKKKNTMNVRGTSIKGTYSIDRYSLSGFTAAHKRMKSLCK